MAGAEGFPKRWGLVYGKFPGKLGTSPSEMLGTDAEGV